MQLVPVVGKTGKPLMPCHPARARQMVRKGRARRRFNRGIFYIQLLDREDGAVQKVVVGVDPGARKEAYTVKSRAHTYLNVQADAVTWVKKRVEQRRMMRRHRRQRRTPCRQPRKNRSRGGIPPSTRARWAWRLRVLHWLSAVYPVSTVIVEDIRARTRVGKGVHPWNIAISPLMVGKNWFYQEVERRWPLWTRPGNETHELREALGLEKVYDKLSSDFEAHCVDSWVLANSVVGGHRRPENRRILYVVPLRFHRRQLHRIQFTKGGIRKREGGTLSLGFKRGSWVKHPKWGVTYVGGNRGRRVSLHSLESGNRLTQDAELAACTPLCFSRWRCSAENRRISRLIL